jgi:hypothetical protein
MAGLDLDQLQLLLYFFAGGAVLIFVALVVYITVASRRQRSGVASSSRVKSPAPSLPPADRVMSLMRARSGGPLQVEIAESRYQRLSDVEDPAIKRKIIATAMELIQFTGVLDTQALEPVPMERTQTWREDLRENSQTELERVRSVSPLASEGQPSPAPRDVEARFLNMLHNMGQTSAAPERPGLLDSIHHRLQPKPTEPKRVRTFVDDIDDILQRRVQGTPALRGRDVHVRPGTGGAVNFFFEGQLYASAEQIPSLAARQLIQEAIQEWDATE